MKKFLLMVALLLFSAGLRAQKTNASTLKPREYGKFYIQHLKEGALVYRLNFKTKAINALLAADNLNAATQIRYEQAAINNSIMGAFENYFTFCPVYFISYDSTEAFIKGKRSAIFLDKNLEVSEQIIPAATFFLVGDQGTLTMPVKADPLDPNRETEQRGLMDNALVLRDTNLVMLHDPFPYYVHFSGNWERTIKKLEKKLQRFARESL